MLSPASPRSSSLWNISEISGLSAPRTCRLANARQGGLELAAKTDDLNLGTLRDDTSLNLSSSDSSSPRDREDVLNVHEERLVEVTCGSALRCRKHVGWQTHAEERPTTSRKPP